MNQRNIVILMVTVVVISLIFLAWLVVPIIISPPLFIP